MNTLTALFYKGGFEQMELTLDAQLDRLFVHGIQVMLENREQIEHHWLQVQKYLHSSGKKVADIMDESIAILQKHIFHTDFIYHEETLLMKIDHDWKKRIGSSPSSPFVLTMLENNVHRAIKDEKDGKDTLAVHYVFTKLNEYVLSDSANNPFTIESFLQQLIQSKHFSFHWIALVVERDGEFIVDDWFEPSERLRFQYRTYRGETIYTLTEQILADEGNDRRLNVFSIPHEQYVILFCTNKENVTDLIQHLNFSLQLIKTGKTTLDLVKQRQQWKDAVILFQDSLIRARTFDETLKLITEGFINYLPFERSAIFSYSTDDIGIGISGSRFDSKEIRSITEDVRNFPLINRGIELLRRFGNGMRFLQPLYIKDASSSFPAAYVKKFQLKSVVVTPIFKSSNNELLGAAILDQGANREFTISENTYTALIKFGQYAGDILGKYTNNIHLIDQSVNFSPRELEVLQLMANGESTTSAANILHLSEYTVRDYITSILQKMNAKNRTEAVARAIREGIIH